MADFIGQPRSSFQLAVCLAKQDGVIWTPVVEICSGENFALRPIF